MKITLTKEEIVRAILIDVFARTGMQLQEKDVELNFIDTMNGIFNLNVGKVEIEITK